MDLNIPYKSYFDATPCYLTVQDSNLRLIAANDRFRKDFGEIEDRYCYQIYKHRPEPCESCSVLKTFDDGQSHSSEERIRTSDNRELTVIIYTQPIRDEKGEIIAVTEMSTDITALKRLQNQIRESQEKYSTLFEEVPCYISLQNKNLQIIEANKLHRRDFGTSYGDKCYRVYKHRDTECSPCIVRETFEKGNVVVHEEVVTRPNGEPINVLVHTAPVRNSRGEIENVIEMSADITRVRQLQSQLESLGLLIGSISHGIKGLLNGLDGGVYLVNSGLKSDNIEKVNKGWDIVLRNIARIRSTVLDILYYARDRELTLEIHSPAEIIAEVHDLLKEKAAGQGVKFEAVYSHDCGTITADRKALRSMLVNLSENSLDACRIDRKKTSHNVTLSLEYSRESVLFIVADDGIGMDRETQEKAFTLFFSSKGLEGTGLGLFIAEKIAKSHKGSIRIESEVDRGTRFIIEIPRSPEISGNA